MTEFDARDWYRRTFGIGLAVIAIVVVGYFAIKAPSPGLAKTSIIYQYAAQDVGDDESPSIAYGNGAWVVVWSSNDNLKKGKTSDFNIHVLRSTDGKNWGSPQLLQSDPKLNYGGDVTPHVATDGNNNWLVAWSSTANLNGNKYHDADILMVRSDDNGKSWKDLKPVNNNADNDTSSNYGPSSLEHDWAPQIATAGTAWLAVWTGKSKVINVVTDCASYLKPSKIYTQYTNKVATFGGPQWYGPYCEGLSADNLMPQAAGDGKGNWVLLFSAYSGAAATGASDADIFVVRSTDTMWNAATNTKWDPPQPLAAYASTDSAPDHWPSVATDGQGKWIAVWSSKVPDITAGGKTYNIKNDADLLTAVSTDNGQTWKDLQPLNTNAVIDTGDDATPQIVTDGKGNWVVVWVSNDPLSGIGSDKDILYAVSTGNGKTWSDPKPLHENADSDSGDDVAVQIATDGQEWIAVWEFDGDDGTGLDSDIVVASFSLP